MLILGWVGLVIVSVFVEKKNTVKQVWLGCLSRSISLGFIMLFRLDDCIVEWIV